MKNRLIIGLIALLTWAFTSCSYNDPDGRSLRTVSVDFHVPKTAWAFDNENLWFSYYYPTRAITESVYDYGTWTVSHEYNPGKPGAYLIALPEFMFMQEQDRSGAITNYTRRIDYEVGVGYVRVYISHSDYIYTGYTPEEMDFHMQIVY